VRVLELAGIDVLHPVDGETQASGSGATDPSRRLMWSSRATTGNHGVLA
jgi:hypothetical protein